MLVYSLRQICSASQQASLRNVAALYASSQQVPWPTSTCEAKEEEELQQQLRRDSGLYASSLTASIAHQSLRHASSSPPSSKAVTSTEPHEPQGAGEMGSPGRQKAAQSLKQQKATIEQLQESMGPVLIQPLPVGRVLNGTLHDAVVELDGTYFMDPAKTLGSTMRALNVVKQVLSSNGYVGIINCNPAFQPLMQEAALHCANANVFWYWKPWQAGLLSGKLATAANQPFRSLLRSRGMSMVNVHSPRTDPVSKPKPSLDTLHKWRLLARRNADYQDVKPRALLRAIMAAETRAARLPLEGSLTGKSGRLQLLVNLDLSYGNEAIQEAFTHGILTASVVNAHTPLERITYPIYAGEGHPAFQHFFLDWLLKVVNMLTPEEEEAAMQSKQQGLRALEARRAAAARELRQSFAGPQQWLGGPDRARTDRTGRQTLFGSSRTPGVPQQQRRDR